MKIINFIKTNCRNIKYTRILFPIVFACFFSISCGGGGGGSSSSTSGAGSTGSTSGGGGNNVSKSAPSVSTEKVATPSATNDYFYFTYDDSASIANAEEVRYRLENNEKPASQRGVTYEQLNYENFTEEDNFASDRFDISMGLLQHSQTSFYTDDPETDEYVQAYELGIRIKAPTVTKEARRNVVLTLLIDISGSMSFPTGTVSYDEESQAIDTRLELVRYALRRLAATSLKEGDVINIITFSTTSTVVLKNWSYSPTDNTFLEKVNGLVAIGGTNLDAGVQGAYATAREDDVYDAAKANRIVIFTDADANVGEVNSSVIIDNLMIDNKEGIYFSGIGMGEGFNFSFLDDLTDRAKGAYFSLFSAGDAKALFENKFPALIDVAYTNVIFYLEFPEFLQHINTASEELSQDRNAVQTTNFSYNTSQFFIETFASLENLTEEQQQENIIFRIEYENPSDESAIIKLTSTMSIAALLTKNQTAIKEAVHVRNLADLIAVKTNCTKTKALHSNILDGATSTLITEYATFINTFCAFP